MLGVEKSEVQSALQVRPLLLDSDLFDAEDSDSDMDYTARSPTPPPDGNASPPSDMSDGRTFPPIEESLEQDENMNSSHSDGAMDDEDETGTQRSKSPGNKTKGANSSIAQSRTRRVQKTDVNKIHSESQRIIRESDVSLPYHKPKPLSLNDFFSKKPSHTGVLPVKSRKGLSKHQQITCLTQQQVNPVSNKLNERAALSQPSPSPKTSRHSKQHSPLSQSTYTGATLPKIKQSLEEVTVPQSEHSLRGDAVQTEGDCPSEERGRLTLEDSSDNSGIGDERRALAVRRSEQEVDNSVNTLEMGVHVDDTSASTGEETPCRTVASPEITSCLEDDRKEEGGEKNKETIQSSDDGEHRDKQHLQEDSATTDTPMEKEDEGAIAGLSSPANVNLTPSQTPVSAHAHSSSQSLRQKLLETSLSKVKTLTPRLSGSADSFIDLDNDNNGGEAEFATPSNPGLNRLMERFAKHTAKSTPRPRKEVKLNVVSKETGRDGKEDLKLETVAVTIEGEAIEDPILKVPGAKLSKLKETLQVKMRARREVERQRRKEAYRIDNEDYNEDDGEMTDQSDTDNEGDDGLGDVAKEEKIKNCQFITREAAVDDDDDDDYEPGEDSEYDDNEDATDDNSDENVDDDDDDDGEKDQEGDPTEARVFSTETDEEDEEEVTIKRIKTKAKKKKKLILEDEDEEDEDDVKARQDAAQEETVNGSALELHLDADDEEDEIEDRMKIPDDSSADVPSNDRIPSLCPKNPSTRNLAPNVAHRTERLFLESISSLEGTTDSSDIDKLGESLVRRARSPKKGLALEEKTRDLFESTSNTDGGTTGSSEIDRTSESFTGRTSFNWSAVRKSQGTSLEDSGHELSKQLDNSSNSLDTSYEMMGSVIPAHQPGGGVRRNGCKVSLDGATDAFTPFSKHQSLLHTIPKSSSKLSELTLPVEDTQDLFRVDTPSLTVGMETQQGADTQSFRFSYDDDETQSQFLDENGFLKLRSTSKPKPATKKLFADENASQDQLDELLGLCSGKFTNDTESDSKIRKGLFSQLSTQRVEGTQGNIDELLGLCSGTFAVQKEESQAKSILPVLDDDIDNRSESSFHILSDNEGNHSNHGDKDGPVLSDDEANKQKKRKRIRMMDDEDSDDDEVDDAGDDEEEDDKEDVFDSEDELSFMVQQEEQQEKKLFSGKSQKAKIQNKVSRDFFEEEAQLSGSECESDEDYDADDMPDELEQDEADRENVGTEDQLREQVNKVHMKTMDDDDARRLRLYKEMYLPDGDLHSDSKGRTRQFRWRHLDNDSQMNLFPVNSDDEVEEEQDEDTQWRMERFKREQWLNEQKEKQTVKDTVDDEVMEESSQFDIFMKTAVNKKKKEPAPVNASGDEPIQKQCNEKRISTPKPVKFRHGSFLKRSKGDLAKIASMMKPLTGNPNTARGSRNVLYQAISPPADEEDDKKPQVRRSASDRPASLAPQAKRPRLDRSHSIGKPNSIFSLM